MTCFVLQLAVTAYGQHQEGSAAGSDPEQLAKAAKLQRLKQDEKNIVVQRTALAEFAFKKRRIQRQLEALTVMPTDNVLPDLQQYAARLNRDLKNLERQMEMTRQMIEVDTRLLDEGYRQLGSVRDPSVQQTHFAGGGNDLLLRQRPVRSIPVGSTSAHRPELGLCKLLEKKVAEKD